MQRAIPNYEECRRYKDVSVPWAEYDKSRSNEIKRILDLSELFEELDKPVRRREFKLSRLVILLFFKIFFGLSYRSIASAVKDLGIIQYTTLYRKF